LHGALADIFDALVTTLSETRLEPDLPALLWSVVNLFHRRIDRIERALRDRVLEPNVPARALQCKCKIAGLASVGEGS
jgi:hypothetical protein